MAENIIILGSGIAALQLAAHLSGRFNVTIITKSAKKTSNSYKAQGGIAAVLSPEDCFEFHMEDTLKAGRFHHADKEVEKLVKEGAAAAKALIKSGLPVDRLPDGELDLGLEGAHTAHRILHCGGDATGRYVIEHLLGQLGENVQVIEHELAFELLISPESGSVIGVKTKTASGKIRRYFGAHTVIATGGLGSLYPFTSNHPEIIGDGIAMAYRAGAELADMEFVQFHPTLLFAGCGAKGLVSEAVRGEGAVLVDEDGNPIMANAHPLKDLAPRHIVAYQIYQTLKQRKKVFLNIKTIKNFEKRFPTITEICRQNGVDIHSGLLPVVPGSHFFMGGILTDTYGRTTVKGLYAIGEVACSGVHGANRLASNSLLEGLVFGKRLAEFLNGQAPAGTPDKTPEESRPPLIPELVRFLDTDELKKKMMEKAGIIRNEAALQAHLEWFKALEADTFSDFSLDHLSREEIEKVFMFTNSFLITQSALSRTESRGAHIRADYPEEREEWKGVHLIHSKANGIAKRRGLHEQAQTAIHA
ncbi:L-aspartate oxidase [Weizmannia acidilactici]|uniref:L-aspartate oxidase n=1 Tax=Weizmannia acidilactici TaxID=2607726 RepID=UPI00124EECB2|nr:L-aspartate oxidase [Weizmannia acidilactici]GER67074.1 L-aspartate oxidase [Weizmannia acidilactici]